MTPGGMLSLLETVADEAQTLDVPDDPYTQDALYHAAINVSTQSLELARRIATAQAVGRWKRRT